MNKKLVTIALTLSMVLGITACTSLSQDEENLAEENAINYIKDKYGFKAKVESVDPVTIEGIFPSKRDYAEVHMSYKGDDFVVYISHQEETTDGRDNYQWPEFNKAINEEIESQLDCEDLCIYTSLEYVGEDVTDIEDYFDSCSTSVCILTYGADMDTIENFDPDFLGSDYEVAIRDYTDLHGKDFPSKDDISESILYSQEPMLLNSFSTFKPDENKHTVFKSEEFDGVIVTYDEAAGVTITPTDIDYEQFEYTAHKNDDIAYPFPALDISVDTQTSIYFYFPTSLMPDDNKQHIVDIWVVGVGHLSAYAKSLETDYGNSDYLTGNKSLVGDNTVAFIARSH